MGWLDIGQGLSLTVVAVFLVLQLHRIDEMLIYFTMHYRINE